MIFFVIFQGWNSRKKTKPHQQILPLHHGQVGHGQVGHGQFGLLLYQCIWTINYSHHRGHVGLLLQILTLFVRVIGVNFDIPDRNPTGPVRL